MNTLKYNKKFKSYIWGIIRKLSNLKFTIILLLLIASLSIIGTIIEQDKDLPFYVNAYPHQDGKLWFLNWKTIKYLQLDHLYTTWWFLSLVTIFSSSLAICTLSTQFPILKRSRTWNFYISNRQIFNLTKTISFTSTSLSTLVYTLNQRRYHVFQQNDKIYAYKGLIGRVAPVFVHLSIILLLIGSLLGVFGGVLIQEMVTVGETVHLQNIIKSGTLSYLQQKFTLRVNDFSIKYNVDNSVQQFVSDISILNSNNKELINKAIQVNTPMSFKNITVYQTDWDIIAMRLKFNDKISVQIPCKPFMQNDSKVWICTIKMNKKDAISMVIPDLTGNLYIYNNEGYLINKININHTIKLKSINIHIENILTRTGLQIKTDPGIWLVFLSFSILILSIILSYTSYSQLWIIYSCEIFQLGGKTNRAYLDFEEDLQKIKKQNLDLYKQFLDKD